MNDQQVFVDIFAVYMTDLLRFSEHFLLHLESERASQRSIYDTYNTGQQTSDFSYLLHQFIYTFYFSLFLLTSKDKAPAIRVCPYEDGLQAMHCSLPQPTTPSLSLHPRRTHTHTPLSASTHRQTNHQDIPISPQHHHHQHPRLRNSLDARSPSPSAVLAFMNGANQPTCTLSFPTKPKAKACSQFPTPSPLPLTKSHRFKTTVRYIFISSFPLTKKSKGKMSH